MESTYLSVAQVNSYIKNIFETEVMLQNICVYGEISSYSVSNGIAYFNIKDDNNLLSCVLFGALKFEQPKLGDVVLITGSVSYYAKGGRLSFNATKITPYGKGLLYERFLQLKNDLENKGYFDASKKLPIPKRVNKIGVVTSLTGAVIQDIIDVTRRRNNGVSICIFPVKVQGVGAEQEIVRGINYFSETGNVDCIIVARGGGSLEDLQPFNTEIVADAAFNCRIPLISAVGHETDFTIIDFVSDLRAPTPSAAAELVVNNKSDDYNTIKNNMLRIERMLLNFDKKYNYLLESNLSRINFNVNKICDRRENTLKDLTTFTNNKVQALLNKFEYKLNMLSTSIEKQNPKRLLSQGFTKIQCNGKNIKSIKQVSVGDEIQLSVTDGKIESKIINLKEVI